MLDKHPPPAEGETLPSLDELLRMTADHSSEALTHDELRQQIVDLFVIYTRS